MPTFEERTVIGKLEILETGHIQVRRDRVIVRDGVEISRTFFRYVVSPGEDIPQEVNDHTLAILQVNPAKTRLEWTPEIKVKQAAIRAAHTSTSGEVTR